MMLVSYDIDCDPIADLTSDEERRKLGVTLDDMSCAWLDLMLKGQQVPSHTIVEKLAKSGFVGLKTPSFVPGLDEKHQNLVLWKWSDTLPSKVIAIDPDGKLPLNQDSWKKP